MTDTPRKSPTAEGIADSIKGDATLVKGKLEDATGGLVGNPDLQVKGKMDQVKGKVEKEFGKAERSVDKT